MSHPLLRGAMACLGLLALAGQTACSCNDPPGTECPAEINLGQRCPAVGLECIWPEGKCGNTLCTCRSEPGGFYWSCRPAMCRCTCPCGYTAASTCETLECSEEVDPCPYSAADVCEVICADSRVRDRGIRDRPGAEGPPADLPSADRPALDAPVPDLPQDRGLDQPADRPVETGQDQAADP